MKAEAKTVSEFLKILKVLSAFVNAEAVEHRLISNSSPESASSVIPLPVHSLIGCGIHMETNGCHPLYPPL